MNQRLNRKEQMRIWIDRLTGTWGDPADIRFVIIRDEDLDKFAELTDSQRGAMAERWGFRELRDAELHHITAGLPKEN